MTEIVLESIEDLQERWEMLKFQGIEELLITENFKKTGNKAFKVIGLSMELEDDYVMCYDFEDIIIKRYSALMIFLRESLTDIKLIPIKNGYRERLEFKDYGTIFIEKAS